MFSIIRFAIIFSIFAFGNCKDDDDNDNKKIYLVVPIRVRREPPNTLEFQFNKTLQIEPISLKANEVNFQLSEENNVKKFRNKTPLHVGVRSGVEGNSKQETIKISLEYREPERSERKTQQFLHELRDNSLDEVITVKIEISLPTTAPPQSSNPMESNGDDAFVSEIHPPAKPDNNKIHKMIYRTFDDDFENESCENENAYADKLLETALRHSQIGTHLLLKGFNQNDETTSMNPVDAIQEILTTKLDLPHLEYKILQAKFVNDGILFEMQSPKDVIEILGKTDSMDLGGLSMESTSRSIFDVALD